MNFLSFFSCLKATLQGGVAVSLSDTRRHLTARWEVQVSNKRQKKRLSFRSAIEAIIGHMKVDGLLERCHLKGTDGDAIHAILCGIGHNLRQMRAFWARLVFWLWIRSKIEKKSFNISQFACIAA